MSRTAYPTSNDVQAFLYQSGLISAPPSSTESVTDYTSAIASAVAQWERGTGWVPFLSGAPQTRVYDPPGPERGPVGPLYMGAGNGMGGGRRLFLNAGVRSVTTLKVGVTPTNTGTTLTLNTDYWLRPNNAGNSDRPYTYIEFGYAQWGSPGSITVLAPFGFGATVPDDAWYAILKMSAIEVLPGLEIALTSGMSQIKLGNDSWSFGPRPFLGAASAWQKDVDGVMCRYTRRVIA